MRVYPFTALLLGISCGVAGLSARNEPERGGHGARPKVTFYEHADFRGGSFTVEAGEVLENLTRSRFSTGAGMNDRITSIRIEGDAEVITFQDAGFRGDQARFEHSVANLSESAPGWNDAISSIRVEVARDRRDRNRDRDRGPDRPDFGRVDPIIRRAYRDLLGRDADDGGLRSYRRHLLEDRWTEEQLRHSLRESDEFRGIAERIIAKAFRDLLRREPAGPERRNYLQQMVRLGWTEEEVRQAIRHTDEFRRRSRHRSQGD